MRCIAPSRLATLPGYPDRVHLVQIGSWRRSASRGRTDAGTNRGPNLLRQSENPDNQAHALRFSTGIDLPWKSRYMGTFQYQRMRQDDPFINTAINGLIPAPYPA